MQADTPSATMSALPARAAVALLTMHLRAATQEAIDAEARAGVDEHDAAREQLRQRLALLTAERRRSLDAALAAVRSEADAAVAAARRTADAMAGRSPVVALPPASVEPVHEEPVEPVAPTGHEPVTEADRLQHHQQLELRPQATTRQIVESLTEAQADTLAATATTSAGTFVTVPAATVVIDAEAFARVFATVLAGLLDERHSSPRPSPQEASHLVKPESFWTHARHPDILLLTLTMLTVVVVLAAWLV